MAAAATDNEKIYQRPFAWSQFVPTSLEEMRARRARAWIRVGDFGLYEESREEGRCLEAHFQGDTDLAVDPELLRFLDPEVLLPPKERPLRVHLREVTLYLDQSKFIVTFMVEEGEGADGKVSGEPYPPGLSALETHAVLTGLDENDFATWRRWHPERAEDGYGTVHVAYQGTFRLLEMRGRKLCKLPRARLASLRQGEPGVYLELSQPTCLGIYPWRKRCEHQPRVRGPAPVPPPQQQRRKKDKQDSL